MEKERGSLPSKGEPKVMQRIEREVERDWREERSQMAEREAIVPPIEWPVKTTGLFLFIISSICMDMQRKHY